MKKPELLAPAGSLKKLKIAVDYGADAVYFGGERFSLRVAAENFSYEEIKEGIAYCHDRGRKCYCAVNVLPRNEELYDLPQYFQDLEQLGVDAFIIADLGVFSIAREYAPSVPVHISTQANNVNFASAHFWHHMGAKRIVLARELSLKEIQEIRNRVDPNLELECFVHGAMCVSYSGRCLLSNYMASRDSNRGHCAHPCRWKYYLMEEKRPGEYMEVFEDTHGTFLLNSKDLCMIEHVPKLIEAGVGSFKIEGRVKSEYYVATVTNAYRMAIDAYCNDPDGYVFDKRLFEEVCKVSHREYYTGFYFGDQKSESQVYTNSSYIRECDIVAVVEAYDPETQTALCSQRNRFFKGDRLEVMAPGRLPIGFICEELRNKEGEEIDVAPHPEMKFSVKIPIEVKPGMIIRKDKI
jgi:putative protease